MREEVGQGGATAVGGDSSGSAGAPDSRTCLDERAEYERLRAGLFEQSDRATCVTARDCTYLVEANRCARFCGAALSAALLRDAAVLIDFAATHCQSCSSLDFRACSSDGVYCLGGSCVQEAPPVP